jgi:uncharacterized protein YjiS (DUF1127 family)
LKPSRLSKRNQIIIVLVHNMFEGVLTIMSASTSGANVSPALLPPRRATLLLRLTSVVRLFHRPDAFDYLRHLADAQLRDIGIERHRIGPAIAPDCARWRLW